MSLHDNEDSRNYEIQEKFNRYLKLYNELQVKLRIAQEARNVHKESNVRFHMKQTKNGMHKCADMAF